MLPTLVNDTVIWYVHNIQLRQVHNELKAHLEKKRLDAEKAMSMYANVIYLTQEERNLFLQSEHEYLYEQLHFQHPKSEYEWAIRQEMETLD